MNQQTLTHEALAQKIKQLDPLLLEAIDDVDESLLAEFGKLSLSDRIEWASDTAATLESINKK